MKKSIKKKIIWGLIIFAIIVTISILISFGLPQNISSGISSTGGGGISS